MKLGDIGMNADLTALNERIAREFMGWTWSDHDWLGEKNGAWTKDGEDVFNSTFSPATDVRAAYMVLEKIASKVNIEMLVNGGEYVIGCWIHLMDRDLARSESFPLAISLLAEKIMDQPELRKLFKEEK